jgi:hypothetical protein
MTAKCVAFETNPKKKVCEIWAKYKLKGNNVAGNKCFIKGKKDDKKPPKTPKRGGRPKGRNGKGGKKGKKEKKKLVLNNKEAKCYLERYPDLRKAFKMNKKKAKKHWFEFGIKENRTYECVMSNKEAQCYINRYPDLKKAFKNNKSKARIHWVDFGLKEKRDKSCSG